MAQPTYLGAGTLVQGSTVGETLSVDNYDGVASGQFLLMVIVLTGGGSIEAEATLPSGWSAFPAAQFAGEPAGHYDTRLENSANTTAYRLVVFYKIAGAGEPSSYSVPTTVSGNKAAQIFAWGDMDASPFSGVTPIAYADSIGVTAGNVQSFGAGLSGITTDHRIVRVGTAHSGTNANSWTVPTNHVERGQWSPPTQFRQVVVMDYTPSGTTDPNAGVTPSVNTNSFIAVSFALKGSGVAVETADLVPNAAIQRTAGFTAGDFGDIDEDTASPDAAWLTVP